MPEARDYLTQWIATADTRPPSITTASLQRTPGQDFKPGICGYGWGFNSDVISAPTGEANGIHWDEVDVWFSDRIAIPGDLPMDWQQFWNPNVGGYPPTSHPQRDWVELWLTLPPRQLGRGRVDEVELTMMLHSWGDVTINARTSWFDANSEQLIFNVPGAGPDAPPALLLINMQDTGTFGFL